MIGQFYPIFASISIDLDISAVYMAALFLTFFVLLKFILLDPYLKSRDIRGEATSGAREDADEDTKAAEAKIAEYEERMKTIRNEATDIRETLRTQGGDEASEIIEEVRVELASKIATEREAIEKERLLALEKVKNKSQVLANLIVSKMIRTGVSQ